MKRGEKIKPNDIDKVIGVNIKKYRRLRNLTQMQLAKMLNPPLSYQQIQKYESGASRVYINTLCQISIILNVDIKELL